MGIDIITLQPGDPNRRLEAFKSLFDLIRNFEAKTLTDAQKTMAPKQFSFVPGDTTDGLLSPEHPIYRKYEHQLLTDLVSYYNELFQISGFMRIESHILALYIYILQAFNYSFEHYDDSVDSHINLNKKSLYDIVSIISEKKYSASEIPGYTDFMQKLAEILYVHQAEASISRLEDQFYVLLQQLNANIIDTNVVNRMKAIINHIKHSEYEKFTVGEFFEMTTIFGKTNGSVYSLIFEYATIERETFNNPKEVCEVRQSLLSFMRTHFVEDVNQATMADVLKSYNPKNCTVIREDLMTLVSFKDFPFSDIYEIARVSDEHCYTYNYLAKMVVMNNGILNINSYVSNYEKLGADMGTFYFKHPKIFKDFLEQDIVALYDKVKDKLLDDARKYFTPFIPSEPQTNLTQQNFQEFFTYILSRHNVNLNTTTVEMLMLKGGSSIMDLIGLLGYICYSDDIVNMDQNENADHFKRSSYCIGLMREFLGTYKLNSVAMNNKSLEDIINSNECIHGIGTKLMEFYVNCMYYVTVILNKVESVLIDPAHTDRKNPKSFTSILLKALGINAESQDAIAELKSNFQVAPFMVEIPQSMMSTGFSYMTVVRDDNVIGEHPILNRYVVTAFNIWGSMKTTLIDCTQTFMSPRVKKTTMDYMQAYNAYSIFQYDMTHVSQLTTTLIQNDIDLLINLIRVSYTFQRHRALRFKLFIEYTKNMIEIISLSPSSPNAELYQRIKYIADQPTYDIINLMETKLPLKHLTILDLSTSSHMYGNSMLKSPIFQTYYVDTLESIINMPYQPNNNNPKELPGVFLMHRGGVNIRRQYEYCKVLATMLYRNVNLSNVSFLPLFNENQYSNYNKKMYPLFENYVLNIFGQSSLFNVRMFKNLKFVVQLGEATQDIELTMLSSVNVLDTILENHPNKQELVDSLGFILGELKKLNMITAIEVLEKLMSYGDLLKIYKSHNALKSVLGGLIKLINDILATIRIFMYTVITYYSIIMPANDESFNGLWLIPYLVTAKANEKDNVWLNEYTEGGDRIQSNYIIGSIRGKYHMIINDIMNITCSHGNLPNILQYHFTEINKDIHFLKYLDQRVTEEVSIKLNDESISENVKSNFSHVVRMGVAFKILKESIPYYSDHNKSDNTVLQLLESDYAESQREVFDYLAKIDIMKKHNLRMVQFIQLENILCNIFDNILSTYTYSVAGMNFDLTDPINMNFCKTILAKSKGPDFLHFIWNDFMKKCIVNNQYHDVPFIIFQKVYFSCLDKKADLDRAHQLQVEKEKIFNKIRDTWLAMNNQSISKEELQKVLKALNDTFTPYQPAYPNTRQTKQSSCSVAFNALLKLINTYTEQCSKDGNYNDRLERYKIAQKTFEYTYNWIQSMREEEEFHKHMDSLIRMVETTCNAIKTRIESINTQASSSKGGRKPNKKKDKKRK